MQCPDDAWERTGACWDDLVPCCAHNCDVKKHETTQLCTSVETDEHTGKHFTRNVLPLIMAHRRREYVYDTRITRKYGNVWPNQHHEQSTEIDLADPMKPDDKLHEEEPCKEGPSHRNEEVNDDTKHVSECHYVESIDIVYCKCASPSGHSVARITRFFHFADLHTVFELESVSSVDIGGLKPSFAAIHIHVNSQSRC